MRVEFQLIFVRPLLYSSIFATSGCAPPRTRLAVARTPTPRYSRGADRQTAFKTAPPVHLALVQRPPGAPPVQRRLQRGGAGVGHPRPAAGRRPPQDDVHRGPRTGTEHEGQPAARHRALAADERGRGPDAGARRRCPRRVGRRRRRCPFLRAPLRRLRAELRTSPT